MKGKRFLMLLLAACLSLPLLAACDNGPAEPSLPPQSEQPVYDRNVTDYGIEVGEPFKLPAAGEFRVTDADGEAVELEADKQGRITFTQVGDYILTVQAAGGTLTYNLYVRDTKAPVFGSITQVASCVIGDQVDVTALTGVVDDYSEVTRTYEVYHMAVDEIPVENGHFLAEKAGYYIVVTTATDEAGNYWQERSKIWCGDLSENSINSFDDMFVNEASSCTFNSDIRMGSEGYSVQFTASGTDNYLNCAHPRDLSGVRDIYYWLYFDSSSFKSANPSYSQSNLPEIVSTSLLPTVPGWTRTELADLEWDTWIPVVMTRNSGTAPITGNNIQFYVSNREVIWGLDKTPGSTDGWGNFSGFTYNIFIDNLTYTFEEEKPISPKLAYEQGDAQFFRSDTVDKIDVSAITLPQGVSASDVSLTGDLSKSGTVRVIAQGEEVGWIEVGFADVTILQDFSSGADSYSTSGYGSKMFTGKEVLIGYSGSSLGISFDAHNGTFGRTCYLTVPTEADVIYYYLYFDSSSFEVKEGSPIQSLPALTQRRVESIDPSGWKTVVVDPSQIGWDRWILMKSTREASTVGAVDELFWYLENNVSLWGGTGSVANGALICNIYVDDIFTM